MSIIRIYDLLCVYFGCKQRPKFIIKIPKKNPKKAGQIVDTNFLM